MNSATEKTNFFKIDPDNTRFFVHDVGMHYDALVKLRKTQNKIQQKGKKNPPFTLIDENDQFYVSDQDYNDVMEKYISLCHNITNSDVEILRTTFRRPHKCSNVMKRSSQMKKK